MGAATSVFQPGAQPWAAPARFEDVGEQTVMGEPTGVFMLRLPLANVYLVDGVLIDAGTRLDWTRIHSALNAFASQTNQAPTDCIDSHALTHAHPDNQGSSAAVCKHYQIPFLVGAADRPVAEGRARMKVGPGYHPFHYLPHSLVAGRAHPVTRPLVDGERLGRTQRVEVIETPGHTRGSVSFWVPSARVVVVGDVLVNDPWIVMGKRSFPPTPREPMTHLSVAPHVNRESLAKIMALSPRLICFGHGPPIELEVVEDVETATMNNVVG